MSRFPCRHFSYGHAQFFFFVCTFLQHEIISNMITKMLVCTKEEIRSVIRFLVAKGINGNEICQRLKAVRGDHSIARSNVYQRMQKLHNGITSVKDAPCPGRAHCIVTPETVARTEKLAKQDRRMTLDEIAVNLGISLYPPYRSRDAGIQ